MNPKRISQKGDLRAKQVAVGPKKKQYGYPDLESTGEKNALTPELIRILLQTLEELSTEDTIRTVVIRGAGDKAFCSGYDIGSLPTSLSDDPHEKMKRLNPVEKLFNIK